jgi:hypothetical protein
MSLSLANEFAELKKIGRNLVRKFHPVTESPATTRSNDLMIRIVKGMSNDRLIRKTDEVHDLLIKYVSPTVYECHPLVGVLLVELSCRGIQATRLQQLREWTTNHAELLRPRSNDELLRFMDGVHKLAFKEESLKTGMIEIILAMDS